MDINQLTKTERLAYEAGRADARATRWRIEADLQARDGQPTATAREYQAQFEAEAADAWRKLAEAKGGAR